MQKYFILTLLLLTIVVLFAVQNAYEVTLRLWRWDIKSYVALLIVIAVFTGALLSYLLSIPGRRKRKKMLEEKDERIEQLEGIVNEFTKDDKSKKEDAQQLNNPGNKTEEEKL